MEGTMEGVYYAHRQCTNCGMTWDYSVQATLLVRTNPSVLIQRACPRCGSSDSSLADKGDLEPGAETS